MTLFDLDFWNEIGQTINKNKRRSIMTAFSVFWGVFLLTLLIGLSEALNKVTVNSFGKMATNSCFFFKGQTTLPYAGFKAGRQIKFDKQDFKNLKTIDGVKDVFPLYNTNSCVAKYSDKKGDYSITGKSFKSQATDPVIAIKGRILNKFDEIEKRKVCVIGIQFSKELFGEEDPTGKMITINGSSYTVVGVVKRVFNGVSFFYMDKTALIPSSLYEQLYFDNPYMGILVAGKKGINILDLENNCDALLKSTKGIDPNDTGALNKFNMGKVMKKITNLTLGLMILTWIVGIGTLLAAVIGVTNIMLVAIKERTQEIGIRRALGAQPSAIIKQILTECFILTFIAGIMGLSLAVIVLSVCDTAFGEDVLSFSNTGITFQITFWKGILCMSIVVIGSLIAGILPSNRALTIKAVDAIREE
ncbi:MAG: ABC transporter permease [Bacteroidetes bacterium]|nr:ABC transporter permease [Bacteroidota bacterium]